jgi:hypothetical protein
MPPVKAYAIGLTYLSACAPAELDATAVERAINSTNPTGLDHGWHCSSDPVFKDGIPQPGPCNKLPRERRHWLLEC